MLVRNSLLFIGTNDNSFNELIGRLEHDFTINTCDLTYASVKFFTDNNEFDLAVCSLENCDIDVLRDAVRIVPELLVVFPSEESGVVRELQALGLKHFTFSTEHQTAAERYIRMFCGGLRIKTGEFRDSISKLVYDSANSFSGAHCRSGLFYVVECVKYVLFTESKHISVQNDIYPYLSKIHNVSRSSIDNAIRRYIEYVSRNYDENTAGEFFPSSAQNGRKPLNSDFIFEFADRIFFKYRNEFYRYYNSLEENTHNIQTLRI